MKIKIGIIFGGFTREREISFAGGRTVYDNLNKALFEPVPLFVDSFGNFVLLDWQYVYKGSIRDFYPPVEFLPEQKVKVKDGFQIYAESLGDLTKEDQVKLITKLGKPVELEEIPTLIDFAFLCLHGSYGEDGKIQGLLESLEIPYSGSGILPSAIGIDKAVQKKLMVNAGFNSPSYFVVTKDEWKSADHEEIFNKAKQKIGLPLVVKSATQGSSIGVSVVKNDNIEEFEKALDKSLFTVKINVIDFKSKTLEQKFEFVRALTDIREGIGIPVKINETILYHPEQLLDHLENASEDFIKVSAVDSETKVVLEGFIEGREFSCIVVRNEDGLPVALPPTEIKKGTEVFDYRSKYLPGLSRKITPIDLPKKDIERIRKECENLFSLFEFNVYARIDGFIKADGTIFLNDPNTTSGMMPSSFFFHQAAEIGLNPSQFLTYIIKTSIKERIATSSRSINFHHLNASLNELIKKEQNTVSNKLKIAVILGGYSSERHISVESGRNIFEKLASSTKYQPVPVFLTGSNENHELYVIPVNILLKDNADDIREKIYNYKIHESVASIINECSEITGLYGQALLPPNKITYNELGEMVDGVFIALHGRPGEDGAVQQKLEEVGLPYNGSDSESSRITINKYETNEILHRNGFIIPKHITVSREKWKADMNAAIAEIENNIGYPLISKPVDDGCSSAVRKIKTREELIAFGNLIFRDEPKLDEELARTLKIKLNEEFPEKKEFLVEELVSRKDAKHFLEITEGLLTHHDEDGQVEYEIFEASEALSEGDVLSLEEKFLAGQGQNITPARYSRDLEESGRISAIVRGELKKAAKVLNIQGYARIDAFVRIYDNGKVDVIFIEVNSLPGMTPATCIFHQTAINGYKPFDFIDKILDFAFEKKYKLSAAGN